MFTDDGCVGLEVEEMRDFRLFLRASKVDPAGKLIVAKSELLEQKDRWKWYLSDLEVVDDLRVNALGVPPEGKESCLPIDV